MKTKLFIFSLLFLSLSTLLFAQDGKKALDPKYKVKVGEMAPDFIITKSDGTTAKLSDMRGKVVMLQFTATWCGICIDEMPHIEKDIWLKHKSNKDFVLWGVMLKEGADKEPFMREKTNITYPLVYDLDGSAFGAFTLPRAGVTRNIIVDKTGKIICLTRGFVAEEFEAMKEIINKELK